MCLCGVNVLGCVVGQVICNVFVVLSITCVFYVGVVDVLFGRR